MAIQRRLVVSPQARADIEMIRQYSIEEWGVQRADAYLQQLRASFRSLQLFPELGRPISQEYSRRRLLQANQHIIYYQIAESKVEISRVLHHRMSPPDLFA